MRSFPLIRAGKPTAVMGCLLTVPILLFSLSSLLAVYPFLMIYFLYPCLLAICGLWGGALSMGLGLAAAVASMGLILGPVGAGLGLLYLLPFLAAFVLVVEKRVPFFKGAAIMGGVLLLSQVAMYMVLKTMAGGDLNTAAGEAVKGLLLKSPLCDQLLMTMYQYGFVSIRDDMKAQAFLSVGDGYYTLTEIGRNEMLLSIASLVQDTMDGLPAAMISGSIFSAVGGLGLSLYIGRISAQRRAFRDERAVKVREAVKARREAAARGEEPAQSDVETPQAFRERLEKAEQETPDGFPDLKMPPLSQWFLPRGTGLKVGLLALGYLPVLLSSNAAAAVVGRMAVAVFSSVYIIQGMAALNFLQKKAGVRPSGRRATLIILYIIFQTLLQFFGVLDQIANFRALRPPLGQNSDGEDE